MIGQFRKLEEIGKGSFAMVYRGIHVKHRSLVAIKSVHLAKLNKKLKENLLSEIKILKSLHHPHIVALIDCQESTQYMHLVMEFCELGDLSTFIKKRNSLGEHEATADMIRKYPNPAVGGLNEVVVRHFLKQMASALRFLRARNFVHRDIKPQNLLLNPSPRFWAKTRPEMMPLAVDENSLVPAAGLESLPMLKIADFGFARFLPQTSLAETLCGSPLYMAPEILRYEKYGAGADLWSVGTVLHEMMVSKPPFRANNHVELLRKIEKQDDRIKFPEGCELSREMKTLIRALLKKSPTERMSYEDFFASPVISDDIPGLVEDDLPAEPEPETPALSRRMEKQPSRSSNKSREQSEYQQQDSNIYSISPRDGGTSPKVPMSRTSSTDQRSATSSRPPSSNRRYSHVPAPTSEQQYVSVRERRPSMISHATAPARQIHDRVPTTTAALRERRDSRPSPTQSPLPTDYYDRDRTSQRRAEERELRETRERAAQDVAFERDYVLVEKRQVEVNALADELAASPQLHSNSRDHSSSPQYGGIVRRPTTQGAPSSTTGATSNPSRAISISRPREAMHQRTNSYERRYGPNASSATSAISKALNMANFRLFGYGLSPPSGKGPSPPQGYGAYPSYPTAQGSLVVIADGRTPESRDQDTKVLVLIEELASRSDVVYGFAEVKYKQLLPATPANDRGLGIGPVGDVENPDDDDLTIDAVVIISEEALVLYVKALSILARGMDLAADWWDQKNRGEIISEHTSPRSGSPRSNVGAVGARMNNVVQWVRERFNECVQKSDFVSQKLVDAQKRLPLDHPGHPSNHHSASTSATSIGTSAENIILTTGITAEKLMYDRAVEMSRSAAVSELVGDNFVDCEINYCTAIRMLEAILESDEGPSSRRSSITKVNEELINGLETEDRQTVIKLVESIKGRLKALRKKIEIQKANKRSSITGMPGGVPSRLSPSATPLTGVTPPR
ncbi:Pkinase-domain-containing protein [Patellaria atrata CBS 101060]|uniref:non-specific serine/threonine protein kinase n=1 Tax=Patellaria atrata CBS 101060 TaxID=1346257 RepID=A0A9P4SI43_9PEZI|nr:Pkinase-domain-containing protein [Patellaria atrata CBS 101060]